VIARILFLLCGLTHNHRAADDKIAEREGFGVIAHCCQFRVISWKSENVGWLVNMSEPFVKGATFVLIDNPHGHFDD
jgi:hypothetical protein